MTESRKTQLHRKVRQGKNHHGDVGTKHRAEIMTTGVTAYKEEFERDRGPDLDEALDGTESGQEF